MDKGVKVKGKRDWEGLQQQREEDKNKIKVQQEQKDEINRRKNENR